jgi:catechol 2,3-dioxygenase-like lactoylglutathione lyase family enzyme
METAVGVSNISVVYLYVRSMERSLRFYRDLLGIPLAGDEHWTETAFAGGTRFALHAAPEGMGDFSSGTVSVSLEVEDVDRATARLREHGVEVGETMREDWGTAADVVDPDGYTITLFQRPG